ncbi:MAG: endonuclease MutS2 [Synergistes sp.]|nr:endonuclease MutS2 [Synergistes sp.]
MYIDDTAYKSLEIDKINKIIAKKCRSEIGEMVAENIKPAHDMTELKARQSLFSSVERYRDKNGDLPWTSGLVSVAFYLEYAEENGLLSGEELLKIRVLLALAGKIKARLYEEKENYCEFALLLRELRDFEDETEMLSVIDEDAHLYDCASEKLAQIRDKMRGLKDTIRRKAHAILNEPSVSVLLQERVLALRNGRYVFLVRQDAMPLFPGSVVDRSGSGNSVYMEPRSLMTANNEYSKLYGEEMVEETRIFREFTAKLIKRKNAILAAENVMGTIDLFYALSEMMRIYKWRLPELSDKAKFSLVRARHPLLGEKSVPIEIKCGDDFRILVITGPNTGGKTVALKTAGVCAYFAWLGFPIPAGEGSQIGNITEIFTDIGDEQSIEQSLSTFSAHIMRISGILNKITSSSLVMLDELGAGTDPEEGAALGIAILDWLREKGALVLATTHHNPIKRYALATDKIETASVEFDITTLSPTYKILVGIPGRSNAILIAGKLGMKRTIINRAQKAINGHEVSMEDLIGELQEKRTKLEYEIEAAAKSRKETEKLERSYEAKIKSLEEKRDDIIAKADKKAVSIIKNAEESAKALIKNMEDAESEAKARRELEKKRSHFHKIEDIATKREEKIEKANSIAATTHTLTEGDTVTLIGTNKTATVVECNGKKARIRAGVAEIEVPITKLKLSEQKKQETPKGRIYISRPKDVPSSIMVRGMTIDEAMPIVEQYLDRAYCAGYDTVTVIHGRGEGILRREVQDLCKRLPYIKEHNLGGPHEGGYGVTVVKFKR